MISELTPTIVLIRQEKRPDKTPIERARWVVSMHTRRLGDPYLRSDTRAQLEHELAHWQNKLKELEAVTH